MGKCWHTLQYTLLDSHISQEWNMSRVFYCLDHQVGNLLGQIYNYLSLLEGTGKTLMAREIGKMLQAREPLIVSGPEILNKYVGQSEEHIRWLVTWHGMCNSYLSLYRNLFTAAEKEEKERGIRSALHIIIFDEIDAICRTRGSIVSHWLTHSLSHFSPLKLRLAVREFMILLWTNCWLRCV